MKWWAVSKTREAACDCVGFFLVLLLMKMRVGSFDHNANIYVIHVFWLKWGNACREQESLSMIWLIWFMDRLNPLRSLTARFKRQPFIINCCNCFTSLWPACTALLHGAQFPQWRKDKDKTTKVACWHSSRRFWHHSWKLILFSSLLKYYILV